MNGINININRVHKCGSHYSTMNNMNFWTIGDDTTALSQIPYTTFCTKYDADQLTYSRRDVSLT